MSRTIEHRFIGYQSYEPTRIKLHQFFKRILVPFHARSFLMGVNEAVSNVCRYYPTGPEKAPVCISVLLTESELRVAVLSNDFDKTFQPADLQKKFRQLADDPSYANMDWGRYVRDSERGTGFWFMLQASDYVIVDLDDGSVILSTHRQMRLLNPRISYLAAKFFIRKGGVIS